MKVYIEKDKKLLELPGDCTGRQLLNRLQINPQTVLIAKNDEIVLAEETLSESDDVKILSVISGG